MLRDFLFGYLYRVKLSYSFIIPVFNRPQEIDELLQSMQKLNFTSEFEIVIVEDGSTLSSKSVVDEFKNSLNISYYFKENSGPGDSRNFGMSKAKGNYFLILDSDVILPQDYLLEVDRGLSANYTDCFGGPDAAHDSFTDIQKAINYVMTSFITTGGIRGNKTSTINFEPRSFNMGLSKTAFLASNGFGKIHPGEDPDLSLRLLKLGFKSQLLEKAKVFHKRRINWHKFFIQVNKFGKVRPILTKWHPTSAKLTFWFPLLFCLGFLLGLIGVFFNFYFLLYCYFGYTLVLLIHSTIINKSIKIGFYSVLAMCIQFYGYGTGFAVSKLYIGLMKRQEQQQFPNLFFK